MGNKYNGEDMGSAMVVTMLVTIAVCCIVVAVLASDIGISEEHADGICQQIYGEGVVFDDTENGVIHCIEQSEENIVILDS